MRGAVIGVLLVVVDSPDACRHETLGSAADLIFHLLMLDKAAKTASFDDAVMDEDILAVSIEDEAETGPVGNRDQALRIDR